MPDVGTVVESGRRAFAAADFGAAFELLGPVRDDLEVDDLTLLARSAWFLSRVPDSIELFEEVFRRQSAEPEPGAGADTALLLALLWFARGELTIMSGWMSRARRRLDPLPDSPSHGYLAYLDGMTEVMIHGTAAADSIARLHDLATRLRDPAVEAFDLTVSGVADLRHGDVARGFARLDEAMLTVIGGQVRPEWGGDIYCTVIHVCHELADFPRMADWTRATEQWCARFASEAVYPGICRVHRLELRGVHGDWAGVEAQLAAESAALRERNDWVAGEGFYQLGELRRRRGDHAGARESYGAARELGIDPQPGEALLLLAEQNGEAAWAALTASLGHRDLLARVRLLRAGVQIGLTTGRTTAARALCRELGAAASAYGSTGFAAWAA
ncbi:LuxR family transcriptional regulator [Microbacterium sp. MC2]